MSAPSTTTDLPHPTAGDLTYVEAGQRLGMSRFGIRRLVLAGHLSAKSVRGKGRDGAKRITVAALAAYLDEHTVRPYRAAGAAMTDDLPPLYFFEEIAEKYGFSLRSMKDDANAGKFKHVRYRGHYRMTPEQLAEFLRQNSRDDRLQTTREAVARRRARQPRQRRAADPSDRVQAA